MAVRTRSCALRAARCALRLALAAELHRRTWTVAVSVLLAPYSSVDVTVAVQLKPVVLPVVEMTSLPTRPALRSHAAPAKVPLPLWTGQAASSSQL